jgi:F0F1-type ATP synthase membrane subunit c/vacuolar-type H+-ATPase subunit K
MAAATTIIAGAALAVTAVGTAASISQGRKASKEQKKAQEMQARRDDYAARQEQLQQLRQQQQQRASIIAQGAGAGTLGSSGVQGSAANVATTGAANTAFVEQINQYNAGISSSLQSAADAGRRAGNYSALANLGTQAYGATGVTFSDFLSKGGEAAV